MKEVVGWVFDSAVLSFMAFLARWVGYAFDELDGEAIDAGVSATDAEADRWFEYPLPGEPALRVRLARDVGTSVVHVRVVGGMDAVLEARVETLIDVLSTPQ